MSAQLAHVDVAAPSRHSNPFATCWTRPGALPFHFVDGESLSGLLATFDQHDCRGAIIGPHGSGKTSLLETLAPAFNSSGWQVRRIALHDRQRRLPATFLSSTPSPKGRLLLIVDGYEQLGWLERRRLERFRRRHRTGLLITAHLQPAMPVLIRLTPNRRLIGDLVAALTEKASTLITAADIAASHACHGSNVREILFDLYDRHERRRRA